MRRFALISLGLHAALIAAVLVWLRQPPAPSDASVQQGAVELVLEEHRGSGITTAPPAPVPDSDQPAPPPMATPPPTAELPPPATEAADEPLPLPPLPPPSPPVPASVAQPSPPAPPATQQALEIRLGGTDSETDAIVTGGQVIPASLDAKYHNQEPVYPTEAVRRAQQGAVMLLVHVSASGFANSVDVMQGSGFALLDRAARDAVATWHFLPAVQDGRTIPFDMAFRVVFRLD
nr:hypothetical protein Hi04_10k_c377_00033 [uncultured bacterium]